VAAGCAPISAQRHGNEQRAGGGPPQGEGCSSNSGPMFILHKVSDTVRVPCAYFLQGKATTLTKLIDDKYSNKVVRNVGLCICLHSFDKLGDSYVYPGDGAAHTEVEFSLIVFKPFEGEVIEGVVCEITKDYLRVSTGYFDNIYVAAASLPQPSEFTPAHDDMYSMWTWKYFESEREREEKAQSGKETDTSATRAEEDEEEGYFMEVGHTIRVQVKSVEFSASPPKGNSKSAAEDLLAANTQANASSGLELPFGRERSSSMVIRELANVAPMVFMAQCQETSTGMIEWWDVPEGDQDEDGENE